MNDGPRANATGQRLHKIVRRAAIICGLISVVSVDAGAQALTSLSGSVSEPDRSRGAKRKRHAREYRAGGSVDPRSRTR